MLETLFTIGDFQLKTLNVFQVVAFLTTAFMIWKRAKEENYSETRVFDGFLLSFLFGIVTARIGQIILFWNGFGWDPVKWVNLVQHPGLQLLFGLIGATLYLFFYSKKQKWDAFEVLDWWSQAVAVGLIWLNIGYFFAGVRFGNTTSLPWGIIFPGVFEKRHPVQLYFMIFHTLMFKFLNYLEYNYRTFEWYRSGKKTAQTGFVFFVFVMCYSIFSLIISALHGSTFIIGEFSLDAVIYLSMMVVSMVVLLNRAERSIFSFSEKKFFAVKK